MSSPATPPEAASPPLLTRAASALARAPETNLLVFALLLNFPWEFLQSPLYEGMADAPHWPAVKRCARAAGGDAAIMLLAYAFVAAAARDRRWGLHPTWPRAFAFVAAGLAVTVAIEFAATATSAPWGWRYTAAMPTLPVLGTGLAPVLQWLALPPATLWMVRRQLA